MVLFGILLFCILSGWKYMWNMVIKEKEKLIENEKKLLKMEK